MLGKGSCADKLGCLPKTDHGPSPESKQPSALSRMSRKHVGTNFGWSTAEIGYSAQSRLGLISDGFREWIHNGAFPHLIFVFVYRKRKLKNN